MEGTNLSPIRYCPLWKCRWALVLKDLLNSTSGRDTSHSCLISLWPKDEWYTFVRGTNFSLIKYCPLWKWRWTLVLTDLLNPISGRDASHSCLISLWPKDECTTITHKDQGSTPFPKQTIPDWGMIRSSHKSGLH